MFQLGIDVSKKTLDLCLLREGVKGRIKTRKLKNNRDAANTVIAWLHKHNCAPEITHVVMESTGVYHEELSYGLYNLGIKVSLANPHRSREFARGMDIITKNDKVDAYVLACYGALKNPEAWLPPTEEIRHLSSLLRRRDTLVTDTTREKNRLEKANSTHTPSDVIESIERMLCYLNEEKIKLSFAIEQYIELHPDLKKDLALLTSIKSVGIQLGVNMLVILRSRKFRSAEQAAAFLGVIPVKKRSGTSVRGEAKLSKIGPPEIRAKLYLAALCGIRYNPTMKTLYERLCQRGKAKMCAIGALMRKLVHWCYGVLHTQLPFDAEYLSSETE